MKILSKMKGFTLAEVLITLTIIGVVAALTIPSLLANVNDKTYDAKRKGFATRMAQAVAQMDSLNSYGAINSSGVTDDDYIEKNSSMNFIIEGLSKVYKITNVCEFENFAACDFPKVFYIDTPIYKNIQTVNLTKMNGMNENLTAANLGGINPDGAAFKTKNGETAILWYNPRCVDEQNADPVTLKKNYANEVCVNMIYDLDGANKGPNSFSKDIGQITIFYSDIPFLVAPYPMLGGTSGKYDSRGTDNMCSTWSALGKSIGEWVAPTKEELEAWTFITTSGFLAWTSSVQGSETSDYGWMVNSNDFTAELKPRTTMSTSSWCGVEF